MAGIGRFGNQARVVLPGSEKTPFGAQEQVGFRAAATGRPAPATGRITVSVVLRPKSVLPQMTSKANAAVRMSRAELAKRHGPHPQSAKVLREFARAYGLSVERGNTLGPRTIQLSGTRAAMEKAFGVTLGQQTVGDQTFRIREGSITLPEELMQHVQAVLGLDTRPQAKPHFRVAGTFAAHTTGRAATTWFTPVQVAKLYGYPAGASAKGQTIALIELGGGYRAADITAYFKMLGIAAPTMVTVAVDGGKNAPSTADSADGEVMLDIEVCAAVAPGAKIAVYFAPNTDKGFLDAVSTAIHDTKNKPSVISISWGGPESSWTGQAMTAFDAACQAAASVGVTITVAAGDDGSTDGVSGTTNHVDFPASSPHVLACGGTKLAGSGTAISSEVVWNEAASNEGATGGGVSNVFPLPSWQKNAKVPKPTVSTGGRGVPDVSGDADPETGYEVRVDGKTSVIGGTSAVAPLWAGLIALANAQNKVSAGFINPVLYGASGKTAFRDITQGNNGGFKAGTGWDPCTGLGSPIGTKIVSLVKPAAAGTTRSTAKKKPAGKKPAGSKVKKK